MNRHSMNMIALVACCGAAAPALAQQSTVRINEVLINAPGGGGDQESKWEYIELSGCKGTGLSGLAVVMINDEGSGAEVDECFVFDSGAANMVYELSDISGDSAGFFVLWNTLASGGSSLTSQASSTNSPIYNRLRADIRSGDLAETIDDVVRHEASFEELAETMGSEDAGDLSNDGSATFLLIDLANSFRADGTTPATASDIAKDTVVTDTNNDGVPDGWQNFVIVDAIAYSNGGGEFAYSEADEFDLTPGFNPDALTRVNDISAVLPSGSSGTLQETGTGSDSDQYRSAYTDFVAGDIDNTTNLGYKEGFGGVVNPAGGTAYFSTDDADDASIVLTPGDDNTSFSLNISGIGSNPDSSGGQVSPSCRVAGGPDMNDDGVVDFRDLVEAAQSGDAKNVRSVLNAIR